MWVCMYMLRYMPAACGCACGHVSFILDVSMYLTCSLHFDLCIVPSPLTCPLPCSVPTSMALLRTPLFLVWWSWHSRRTYFSQEMTSSLDRPKSRVCSLISLCQQESRYVHTSHTPIHSLPGECMGERKLGYMPWWYQSRYELVQRLEVLGVSMWYVLIGGVRLMLYLVFPFPASVHCQLQSPGKQRWQEPFRTQTVQIQGGKERITKITMLP